VNNIVSTLWFMHAVVVMMLCLVGGFSDVQLVIILQQLRGEK
jgi:hypothetical protein